MDIHVIAALIICFYFLLYPQNTMSQKALILREVATPLILAHRPIPQPGKDQLLVKVLVAGCEFHSNSSYSH